LSCRKQAVIKEALAEAKGAAKLVANSKGKSAVGACDRYDKAVKNLQSALKEYTSNCEPVKETCENSCLSVDSTGQDMPEQLAANFHCFKHGMDMANDIQAKANQSRKLAKQCTAFNTPIKQAHDDAKSLLDSNPASNICEKNFAETCRLDASTGKCVEPGSTDSGKIIGLGGQGKLPTETGRVHTSSVLSNLIEKVESDGNLATGGSGSLEGHESSLLKNDGNQFETFGSSGQGAKGASSKTGKNKTRKYAGGSGDSYGSGSGSRRRGSKFKWQPYVPKKLKKKGKGAKSSKFGKNSKLAKYLPGGKNDPNRKDYRDGITSAAGPTIFEKVSNRYVMYVDQMFQFDRK